MGKIWLISGTWHSDWVKAVSRVSLHFKHLLQLLKLFSNDVEPFSFKNIKGLKDAVFFKVPEVGHDLGKWGMTWLSIHSVHSFQDTASVDVKVHVQVTVLVAQSCLSPSDPMDCRPPDSSVHGILQARALERSAISFSRGSSRPRDRIRVSCMAGGFFTI